ncbi:MAG: Crp/Fnr family transcriptional regulator [Chitinophagaceae bacterium]|nr:Crp/Fnr family transcriptional regulator [Chitinophagaceae bacterium]
MAKNTCDLSRCFLCRHSPPAWHALIGANRKNLLFKKGAAIFHEGEVANGMYFVYSGTVKVHRKWGSQKELILRFGKSGDMLGYRGLGDERKYTVSATVIEPAVICYVDLVFFESLLQTNHQLTYQLMQCYANELQNAEKKMSKLAHMNVKARIADTLLTLQNQFGKTKEGYINIQLSRLDMAAFTGTTYETLFRTMQEFIQEKLIKVSGKKIVVLKEKKLAALTWMQ